MKRSFLAILVLPPFAASCAAPMIEAAGGKPNLIFIMVDDMGYNDLGCFGQ